MPKTCPGEREPANTKLARMNEPRYSIHRQLLTGRCELRVTTDSTNLSNDATRKILFALMSHDKPVFYGLLYKEGVKKPLNESLEIR